MTERAVASALEDVMSAVDDYRDDPSDENRRLLKEQLLRFVKIASRHWAGAS